MRNSHRTFLFCGLRIAILLTIIDATHSLVPCHEFSKGKCIRCPAGSHLFEELCYEDIIGCQYYKNGNQCTGCDPYIGVLRNNTCQLINEELRGLGNHQLKLRANIAEQYGSPQFIFISTAQALNNQQFNRVDQYMKNSQYSFHIKKINPLVSVHTYTSDNSHHFKILYEGAGGGLFLCIISISSVTGQIKLSSFVAIGKSQIIENCVEYDPRGTCRGCNPGYHLDTALCYVNIGECISYYQNLCIQCRGLNVLIENRCAGDCKSISDCRSNIYYQGTATEVSVTQQTGRIINTTLQSTTQTKIPQNNEIHNSTFISSSYSQVPNVNSQQNYATIRDVNCAAYKPDGSCERCSFRCFKSRDGLCQAVNPLCRTFDQTNGKCTDCYHGFELISGVCITQSFW